MNDGCKVETDDTMRHRLRGARIVSLLVPGAGTGAGAGSNKAYETDDEQVFDRGSAALASWPPGPGSPCSLVEARPGLASVPAPQALALVARRSLLIRAARVVLASQNSQN